MIINEYKAHQLSYIPISRPLRTTYSFRFVGDTHGCAPGEGREGEEGDWMLGDGVGCREGDALFRGGGGNVGMDGGACDLYTLVGD